MHAKRNAFANTCLVGFALLGLASCGTLGDTTGSLLVSDQDEYVIGQQFDANLRADATKYPLYNLSARSHQTVKDYVDGVMKKVLDQVPTSERPSYFDKFKVTIIDAPEINAFAVPGGGVYVYTGILDTLRNEAELAAILAHEITHVVHHHYRVLLAQQYGVQAIVNAVGGDSSGLSRIATGLLALKFSRVHETDSDKNGTLLSGKAGYNPLGVADFFKRMPEGTLEVLSDHPSNSARVDAVTQQVKASTELAALAWTDPPTNSVVRQDVRFQERYLAMKALIH